ncbi:MAG: aldehyde dehydrogenase [Deltaproteobacteria bacterium]|nr:aldehyde dehydrogenase [Deltaproteobacteria bacterium]
METQFKSLEDEIISGKDISVPDFLKTWLAKPKLNFIGNRLCESNSKKVYCNINPATEEDICWVVLSDKTDVEKSIQVARDAFNKGDWSQLSQRERAKIVKRLGELIIEHRAPLAILESLDTGKPIFESFEGDIPRSASNFQFFAEFAEEEEKLVFQNLQDEHTAFREPLGVVALITPWNLPLYLATWKIAPALMMGHSIVLKPSELTPLTACYFAELTQKAGLPSGVFNVVHGFGDKSAGEFLVSDPGIDAVSFTGETSTGRAIMRSAAVGPTRVSFELGGKGATIIFEDADILEAVQETLKAGFRNQGQICLATPRIFVHKNIYSKFRDLFVEKANQIKVGNPLNYSNRMGSLIGREHWEKVMGYVCKVEEPMKILSGGDRPREIRKGAFLAPTVIENVPLDHPISREEIFGPVVSLYSFENEVEVIKNVNNTQYGLSASIWTIDSERAERVSRAVQSGLVWINCWFARDLRVPFGGQKRSGIGREGGKHSLDFFSDWKSVCVRRKK